MRNVPEGQTFLSDVAGQVSIDPNDGFVWEQIRKLGSRVDLVRKEAGEIEVRVCPL